MKLKHTKVATLAASLITFGSLAGGANAAVVVTTVPTIGESGSFSDGANDYFGLVDAGGTTIAATTFNASDTNPIAGSVAGRDHDDGGSRPTSRTAIWSLGIPSGVTTVSAIDFTGTLAAMDNAPGPNWAAPGSVLFELKIDGVTVSSENYTPNGSGIALALNGTGVVVTDAGIPINLTHAGGSGITSVELVLTADTNGGAEEWWASGTLSATAIPEPSSAFLLGLGAIGFIIARRRKN